MTWRVRGRIENGRIVFDHPLDAPDGLEVLVRIESVETKPEIGALTLDFSSLPFFGIWADRTDIADSAEWVHQRREQWRDRANRQD